MTTDPQPDPLADARATNQRLNLRAQRLESELATYRRAVAEWEISDQRTYVPLRTLGAIAKAAGLAVPERWELHYQRVERAEAALADALAAAPVPPPAPTDRAALDRVRALHQPFNRAGLVWCAHCSHWDGRRARGVLTDYPCDTLHALDEQPDELRRVAVEAPAPNRAGGETQQQPTDEDVVEAHRLALSFALDGTEAQQQPKTELASLAVNAANALRDEKRHYEIACQENARLRAVVARLGQMADHWEQQLPEVIRTPAVVSAIRAALERAA